MVDNDFHRKYHWHQIEYIRTDEHAVHEWLFDDDILPRSIQKSTYIGCVADKLKLATKTFETDLIRIVFDDITSTVTLPRIMRPPIT